MTSTVSWLKAIALVLVCAVPAAANVQASLTKIQSDTRSIQSAVSMYTVHTGALPPSLEALTKPATNARGETAGPFLSGMPRPITGWGPYVYTPKPDGTFTVRTTSDFGTFVDGVYEPSAAVVREAWIHAVGTIVGALGLVGWPWLLAAAMPALRRDIAGLVTTAAVVVAVVTVGMILNLAMHPFRTHAGFRTHADYVRLPGIVAVARDLAWPFVWCATVPMAIAAFRMRRARRAAPGALGAALAIAALTASVAIASEHDCTYDQDDQRRVVRELAARYPGGRLEKTQGRVTWTLPSGGSIDVLYGGCTHLGSIVTRTEPRSTALSRDRVFAIASDLATKYWKKPEAEDLKAGLAKRDFQTESADGRTYYHVRHEDLSQFYVEYEFTNGTSRVAIAWSRNF